jgi:transposase
MAAATDPFAVWLDQASIPQQRLSPEQHALLHAVFRFRQHQGDDYYSTRLLSHFLLHCDAGLKVAQLARLLRLSRPTASRHQGLSSKQAIQQAHHRMDGRPSGKLLPRYAGPIAQFLFARPNATRADLSDFIDRTFGVRVARVALYKFLKKYGLQALPTQLAATALLAERPADQVVVMADPGPASAALPVPPAIGPVIHQGQALPSPLPPFSPHARSTQEPSC